MKVSALRSDLRDLNGAIAPVGATTLKETLRHCHTSAVTELVFNPKRHSLLSFNHLPHLDDAAYSGWLTYA